MPETTVTVERIERGVGTAVWRQIAFAMEQAIRRGDADKLEDWFTRTRAIRRSIIAEGQDDARPDFGRADHGR